MLSESKGVLDLLDAVAGLREEGLDVRLTLMGPFESDEMEATLRGRVQESRLADYVHLPGVLQGEAKWQAFRSADIFCFPSRYESETFGLVVLEAMQFGLPVVATRWRGIPALVEDGETGLLVPIRDVGALTDALASLCRGPERARSMGAKGRESYLKHYTIDEHRRLLEDLFVSLRHGYDQESGGCSEP